MAESKKAFYRILKTTCHRGEWGLQYVVQRKNKFGIFRFWRSMEIGWETIENARLDMEDMIDIDNGVYKDAFKDEIVA